MNMRERILFILQRLPIPAMILLFAASSCKTGTERNDPPDYTVRLEVITHHWDSVFNWTQARVTAVPGMGRNGNPALILTMQKWFVRHSDFYSGLYTMRSDDLGATWSEPQKQPALSWRYGKDSIIIGICDFTPGWHPQTKKVLAIGHTVYYKPDGRLLGNQRPRATAYAVCDPATGRWSPWQQVEMPDRHKFYNAGSGCGQWLVKKDGTLLIPVYFKAAGDTTNCYASTVMHCSFDGEKIRYLDHGDELTLPVPRGVYEPSLTFFRGRYYLTLRNDIKAYVTVSRDAMHWQEIRPWRFDDGTELGSYNTQQHWVTHSDGLFLVYTRRDTANTHIPRSRAPLFMARVDPDKLIVLKKTEVVLIPERGAMMGNFGASYITEKESWVTVGENMYPPENLDRGADGSVFAARIRWTKPNRPALPE